MKKFLVVFLVIILIICSTSFALDLSGLLNSANQGSSQEKGKVTSAVYLDTVAGFDIPDKWVYEGVIFDEKYSQKKYTLITNLDVSVLYGLRDLDEEIKKTMPFLSADALLGTMSEQNLIDIIASASESDVVEKLYGSNKFYEFEKTQQVTDRGKNVDVHSIIDMCIIDSNIFSFSYSYRDKKDGIQDYAKMLSSFKLKNGNTTTPKIETTPPVVETTQPEVIVPPVEEKIPEEPKVPEVENNTEIKNEENVQEIVNNEPSAVVEEVKPEVTPEVVEEAPSQTVEVVENIDDGLENTIEENQPENVIIEDVPTVVENEPEDENIGIVIKTNERKSFLQTILSVIGSNHILLALLIGFVVLDIVFSKMAKKRKKDKENQKVETTENIDKKQQK